MEEKCPECGALGFEGDSSLGAHCGTCTKITSISLFVDSLKEWCDERTEAAWGALNQEGSRYGVMKTADDLLEFAVQRLELIKGQK